MRERGIVERSMIEQDKGMLAGSDLKTGDAVKKYCIACGAAREHRLEPLAIEPDAPSYRNHRIATCNSCGLHSSYPMPDREELRRWYVDGRGVPQDSADVSGPRAVWHRTHDSYMVNLVGRFA